MTSNLAKFVSGNHNTSPTTNLNQSTAPRSPRSPTVSSPALSEKKSDDSSQAEPTLLTIEQFKWSILCCCNEIKSRVSKQRSGSSPVTNLPSYSTSDVNGTLPASQSQQASSATLTPRKFEKSKASRNSAALQATDAPLSDVMLTLKSLLLVMSVPTEDMSQRAGQRDSAQIHNPSLLSLMGGGPAGVSTSSADTVASDRARSINQMSQYSSSFHSLAPSVASTALITPSLHSTTSSSTPQPRLRSKKSQSKIALVQATDAVLQPLTMEELVRLLAYTLSIAPEQWIPWHLYDFFILRQGQRYKDLIELLPTHGQRILRSILETVDALVDYAVMMAMSRQQQQQQQPQQLQLQLYKSFSKPKTAAAAMVAAFGGGNGATLGEYTNGPSGQSSALGNGLRQQLSHAHLRSKSEATNGANRSAIETAIANLVIALTAPESPSQLTFAPTTKSEEVGEGNGDSVPPEIAVRTRKRRATIDSLAGLVFRSRKDMSSSLYESESSPDRDVRATRPTLDSVISEDKSKSKRRYSYAVSGASGTLTAAATTVAPSPATVSMRLQASEKEREAGLRAFENLLHAFEEEFHPLKNARSSSQTAKAEALAIATVFDANVTNNGARSSLSIPNSPIQDINPSLDPVLSPQQECFPPGPNTTLDAELAKNRPEFPNTEPKQEKNEQVNKVLVDKRSSLPVNDNGRQLMKALSLPARPRPKSDSAMSPSNLSSPPASHITRSHSTILSTTWSAWKGHLLVLEEEEFVIEDASDVETERREGSASKQGKRQQDNNDDNNITNNRLLDNNAAAISTETVG
ncbi:hypothetical protein BGZ46_008109 [Entomortierella lignicola]|nr:hypothetical protein BGZ46_008109 [Entomortierella lignicola]